MDEFLLENRPGHFIALGPSYWCSTVRSTTVRPMERVRNQHIISVGLF